MFQDLDVNFTSYNILILNLEVHEVCLVTKMTWASIIAYAPHALPEFLVGISIREVVEDVYEASSSKMVARWSIFDPLILSSAI